MNKKASTFDIHVDEINILKVQNAMTRYANGDTSGEKQE